MNSTVSRRALLKGFGITTAAGFLTGSTRDAGAFDLLSTPEAPPATAQIPTVCEVCFWNCGAVAHVRNNRVLHLQGHPQYPNARGKLCARGNAGAAFVSSADRLAYPMIRVGKRGEGKFERVGWPVAYQTIARQFRQIKDRYGAQALALFYHGSGGPMLRTMFAALGSPNFAAPAYAQCKGPRDVGYKLTYGVAFPSPEPLDMDSTKCVVLFGSHLGENAHNSQVQDLVRARARGAKLVVLDPRFSTVASKADLWLPVRPGSDTAVILSWVHLLIEHDTYHKEFVRHQCTGFAELAAHVRKFTPAWAAEQSGVKAQQIEAAYDLMTAAMPSVVVHPGRHVAWYGEADTQRARAQAILTALLGAWWTPGGVFRPAQVSLPEYPGPDFPELPPNVDKAASQYPFEKEVSTTGIRDATRSGKPYPIKGWFVHASNLIQSLPNVNHTLEAIKNLDFLVVSDIQPTEITRYADVLLPEDTYLERYDDLSLGAGKTPYIGLRQPVVKSPHDTRPAWRIAKELGNELGVGDFFAFETIEEYLSTRLKDSGVTLDELKLRGIHFPTTQVSPYQPPDVEFHWHTPSGKVELYSRQLQDAGFAPLPVYVPQPLPPEGMMRLIYGRSPLHTFGRTQNNAILHDIDPTNCVWMNPVDAVNAGIANDAWVMVVNASDDSTGPLSAKVTERVQQGTVYMVHGFGHKAPGLHLAMGQGGSDSEVIRDYAVDPITGATGMRVQFVRVVIADAISGRQPPGPAHGEQG